MAERERRLRSFSMDYLGAGEGEVRWLPVTGDASSRRYFRLWVGEQSWICADSPPESEKNEAFLSVQSLLAGRGLPVPKLLAVDAGQGFFLMEDFGDRHLLQVLDPNHPSRDYGGALDLLLELQAVTPDGDDLPAYSVELLREEFSRFYEWFCLAWLGLPGREDDAQQVRAFGELLIAAAQEQPAVFVFRDYHSRNLLVRPDESLGLIDFQDAVIGPLCYDLTSLLRDCYIRWPEAQVRQWALYFRQRLLAAGRPAGAGDDEFLRWFDWIGLHRHLKVLGNFTRLSLRDGKHAYLRDMPLVISYVREVLARYPEFAEFARWFDRDLDPLIAGQSWEPAP